MSKAQFGKTGPSGWEIDHIKPASKGGSDATANLREITCQLWDGVDISPPTRNRSLRVEKPFYGMLAMTTLDTLAARLHEDDILSGLLPRFTFYVGTQRRGIAWPDPPSAAGAKALAEALNEIRSHTQSLRNGGADRLQPRLINPSPAAKANWEDAYHSFQDRAINAPTPAAGAMLNRIPVHIIKAALMYAMCAGHAAIEVDDLDKAIVLGEYLSATAEVVAGTEGAAGRTVVETTTISKTRRDRIGMST
ncbi:MAG: DUF3987 domain-containing protein [Chloroflexi bacterium]|nr:DUF3987 domain-containing protein [Chloroflexota bacterium]